jgi:hypothetical protein
MSPAGRYMGLVASVGCVVCRRFFEAGTPAEIHHVAEGSGLRSDFAVCPLCVEHHRGKTGLHGMGVKAFCVAYRVPGETEYGLLVWVNEDVTRFSYERAGRIPA